MTTEKVKHKINESARVFLRYGALCAPFSMMTYNVLLYFNLLPSSVTPQEFSPTAVITLAALWVILGFATFLTKQPRYPLIISAEISIYYALAVLQTWLVSGVGSAFAPYWIMLSVATYILVGRRGLIAGFTVFTGTAILDSIIFNSGTPYIAFVNLMTIISVLSTSLVFISIYISQHTSYQDLIASHVREQNERNQNLTLINNLTDSIFSTNANGIVTACNSAALNILDTNRAVIGSYISDLMELKGSEGKVIDVFKELSKNSSIRRRDDIVMQLPDEDEMRLEVTFAPVQEDKDSANRPDSYVLILRDITRLKSLEEERDEFISVVSHELRTPVAITEGSLSNAQILAERENQQKIVENINQAHSQVVYLAKMVNDLSTLSRAEKDLSDPTELIDVTELAHQLHHQYSSEAKTAGLQFNLDIIGKPSSIHTSKLYLQELLQNFITNAIKYTEKGSVTLHIEQIDDTVEFAVSDTGIGIGRSDLKRIFSRFYRAEDYRTRETNGTGLGLYVADKLARKIDAEIKVESRLNHGSKFSFRINIDNHSSEGK